MKDPRLQPSRLHLSIRFKMLIVFASVLLIALGTHLFLAVRLFTADKLAYIYDLNASVVGSLAEQTRGSLSVLAKEVELFANSELTRSGSETARQKLASDLFASEGDLVRIEVYERSGELFQRGQSFSNAAALSLLGVSNADLDSARRARPLPLAAIASKPDTIYVQNSSLPPDAPILTLALATNPSAGREAGALVQRRVLAIDFRPDRLLRIFGRSRLHETFLIDERGEVLAHPDPSLVVGAQSLAEHPLVRAALASRATQGVIEFEAADREERIGAYGQVGLGRLAVLTQMSKHEALRASRELAQQSSLFAVAILLAAFLATLFLSRRVTAPIRRLRAASELIGQGRFDMPFVDYPNDEIGDLARAFAHMTGQLKETQSQLIRSERMAAFGALGAGITHEVKNPITALVGFAQLAQKKIDDKAKAIELLKIIESESLRCRDILQNFLKFARGDSGGWERISPSQLVQEAARVLRHQLIIHRVQLEVELGDNVPEVNANAGELQQVLVNLAMNAQQAMPEGGIVRILTSKAEDGAAVIAVSDNGPGIPAEIQTRIFEPFFTTKSPGQGTGLGLAISFSILHNYHGTLSVQSELGKGATFYLRLPPAPAEDEPALSAPAASSG